MTDIAKIILAIIVIGLFAFVLIRYGNTPLSDVPFWVAWLLKG